MGEYCRETQLRYHFAGIKGRRACRPRTQSGDGGPVAEGNEPTASKKQCLEESPDSDPEPLNEENVCFIRSNFIDGMDWRFFSVLLTPSTQCNKHILFSLPDNSLPKSKLYLHAVRNGLPRAQYEVQQKDKLFRATIRFDGQRYTSSFWEKNKRYAEQAAALVCLLKRGVESRDELIRNGAMLPAKNGPAAAVVELTESSKTDAPGESETNGEARPMVESC